MNNGALRGPVCDDAGRHTSDDSVGGGHGWDDPLHHAWGTRAVMRHMAQTISGIGKQEGLYQL